MSNGISSRKAILEALPILEREHGAPPTVQQIADRVGLSKSATYNNLCLLLEAGKISAPPRAGAGWRLT